MKKTEAVAIFKRMYCDMDDSPLVAEAKFKDEVKRDNISVSQDWSNFTDLLCKDGKITEHQNHNWVHPF